MAGTVILSGSTLAAGIRDDFDRTYQQTYDGVEASLGEVMQLNVPSDKRTEIYGLHRTMPYPERWDSGNEAIPEEGTDSLSFSITNYDYAKRIKWRRNDRQDNQVGDLRGKAEQTGRNFASLDSRFDIIGVESIRPSRPGQCQLENCAEGRRSILDHFLAPRGLRP